MYQEILRLDKMLTEANIPHTLRKLFDGWQVCYPNTIGSGQTTMDAIQHRWSYGGDCNQIEIMGLLTPEEQEHDDVVGHLTAEQVFERIRNHYESNPKNNTEWEWNGDMCDA